MKAFHKFLNGNEANTVKELVGMQKKKI